MKVRVETIRELIEYTVYARHDSIYIPENVNPRVPVVISVDISEYESSSGLHYLSTNLRPVVELRHYDLYVVPKILALAVTRHSYEGRYIKVYKYSRDIPEVLEIIDGKRGYLPTNLYNYFTRSYGVIAAVYFDNESHNYIEAILVAEKPVSDLDAAELFAEWYEYYLPMHLSENL
jgi:hypothetical protein